MEENWTKYAYSEVINRGLFYSTASELLNLKSTRWPAKSLLGQLKVAFVLSNTYRKMLLQNNVQGNRGGLVNSLQKVYKREHFPFLTDIKAPLETHMQT